jgi:hypothetical protein
MLGDIPKGRMYTTSLERFNEVKKAMGSKASLPKKTKVMPIGLTEIDNDMKLGLWRYIVNPTSTFDFIQYNLEYLKSRGFQEINKRLVYLGFNKYFALYNEEDNTIAKGKAYLCNRWEYVFDNPFPKPIVTDQFLNGTRVACFVGVIYKMEKVPLKDGRKRLLVSFYNGYELIEDLTIWPDKQGKFPKFVYGMRPMEFGVISIKPKIWNTKRTGIVDGWSGHVAI